MPSSRWATYKQFSAAGLQVAKGSKSRPIFFFKPYSVHDKKTDEDKQILVLRTYNVFNLSQLTNPPVIKTDERPIIELHAEAERIIRVSGAEIQFGGDKAFYSPRHDYVVMPHKDQFESTAAYYDTLFHETAGHWTGHPSRLNRDLSGKFGSQSYAAEECIAEAASAFVSVHIGLVPHPRKESARYINNWKAILKDNNRNILTLFSQAQKAADYILNRAPAPDVPSTTSQPTPHLPIEP